MTLQNALVTPWSRSIVWATVLGILPTWNGSWTGEAQIVLDRFQRFHQRIVDLGLDREIGNPPVLNVSGSVGDAAMLRKIYSC